MKLYWLKVKKDWFKRHDIKLLESFPNGNMYSHTYLKMLLESIDHEGNLRFSDDIPYDAFTLSVAINVDKTIIEELLPILIQYGMIKVFEDGTIFMNEVMTMVGSETDSAVRMREYRKPKKEVEVGLGTYGNVKLNEDQINKLKNDYESINIDELIQWFDNYIQEKGYKSKDHNLAIRRWVVEAYSKPSKQSNKVNRVEQPIDYKQENKTISNEDKIELIKNLKALAI